MRCRELGLVVLLASAGVWGAACSDESIPDGVVAVWNDGRITAEQLERRILELPPDERRPEDGDFEAWYASLTTDLVIEDILADEAIRTGLADEPEVRRQIAEQEEELLAAAYLDRHLPAVEAVTEDDVREVYDERREAMRREAQRLVFHLFKSRAEGRGTEEIRTELSELRRRVLAGENFQLLARDHSDSETRHRDGVLGSFHRGQLPAALDELVFGLPVQEPSEPVMTPQGGHLFWVETALDEHQFEFKEVRRRLLAELRRERRTEAIDALPLLDQLPEGSFVPSEVDLRTIVRAGDPQALVLRVGGFELRWGELRERIEAEGAGVESPPERASRLVDWIRQRFLLARAARAEGLADEPALAAEIADLKRRELARLQAERRLLESIDSKDDLLRRFFENNRLRYTEPLRLRLDVLRVPLGDAASAWTKMKRLEEAARRSRSGAVSAEDASPGSEPAPSLPGLAESLDGSVEELDWMTFDQLESTQPRAAELLAPRSEGEMTPPYRTPDGIQVLRVVERREPSQLPLESVRAQVARDYLETHGQRLYGELRNDLLRSHRVRLADVSETDVPGP